ncbi:resolvase domain-containing protein [gamma proteobacterium BDW918]|nr:resolvase domain-containing protein [gamma proteobacterium BDW918]
MEFIYRRVSTTDQKSDRQLPGLNADRTFEDKLTGKHTDRPQLQALLTMLRPGDVVHCHELSRLARNTRDLLDLVDHITGIGATIKFHKENLTFTPESDKDPFQNLMVTMLAALSSFERELIVQRVREGVAIAKAKGKYKGRKSRFTPAQIDQICTEFSNTKNKIALAARWGVSRSYLYKIAKKGDK